MTDVNLQCACGKVKGEAFDVSAKSGTRIVCYCDDCQAFPRHLGVADSVLDPWGGTDIFQMPQAHLVITEGADQLRCLRFGEKGLYRWYTACCHTPVGNTLGPGMPFIGLIHCFMAHARDRDVELGPSRADVWVKFAAADAPETVKKGKGQFRALLRSIRKLLGWKIRGLDQPSPFFDAGGKPAAEPEILR